MQPKAKHSLRAQAQLMRTETVETFELVKVKQKLLTLEQRKSREKNARGARERYIFQRTIDKYSACVEVGKPIDENSACVEVGTTHKHLRRGDKSNNFKNYFSSNDITCEEVTSVESTFLLDTSYVRATREPEKKEADHIKKFLLLMDIPKTPLKIDHKTLNQRVKRTIPNILKEKNKNCFICGDSSHCARDCEKRFKPKESNDHIHNRINVNTLKVESEKQNSDECANLQYVNIFVENQPVTALIDSGCQIPVLTSSLIRVQTPSEEIITLSSCFGEQRMVEVKPINISLNQHSPSLVLERQYHRS
ncbi:hypothetical protein TNCV_1649241 [Trichonephila clavipes]|nr:hypothetical protein TNCV_1649241 [Trichonephila clavipes]